MLRLFACLPRSRARHTRLLEATLAALVVALLALGMAMGATAATRQLDNDAPSPATGHAQVVAHGVAELPADEVAWRVNRAAAPRPADAPAQDALGFVLADEDALLLNNLDSGAQARLAAGEAAFVPAGTRQEQIAFGDGPVDYVRIDLVPADDANGDELAYTGETFAAPDGDRDLDLVRDVLTEDEEAELSLGSDDVPALFFVTDGAVEVFPADDTNAAPNPLDAGQAAAVAGQVVIRAVGAGGATFIAAVIGPEVPAIPSASASPATATATAESASLTVQAFGCPVAYAGEDFGSDCADPLADVVFRVVIPATEFSVEGTTDADGEVVFGDLDENTYALTGGVPAEFAIQNLFCVSESGGQIPFTAPVSEIPGAVLELGAGDDVTCLWYVIPEDLQGDESGTIALAVKLCPTANTPLDNCDFGDVTAPLTLTGPVTLSTGPGSDVPVNIHGPNYVWGEEGGVPFGTYYLAVDMPAPAGYALDRVAGSLGGSDIGYAIAIDADTPNVTVYLVYVQTDANAPDLGNDGVDYDCADFAELNAAQAYFVTDGGSAARNVDNLDANRNGLACEPGDDGDNAEPGPDLGNDGVDMNCADFAELNAAQAYFVTDGGSPARNVDNLDADRDGAACEPGDDGDVTERGATRRASNPNSLATRCTSACVRPTPRSTGWGVGR